MDSKEYIKIAVLFLLFVIVGPALGLFLKGRPMGQRIAFALMCMMTISGFFGPEEWGLTLGFVPDYRGHTWGYHFYYNQVLAIALIISCRLDLRSKFRWFPPGLWLYLLFWALSLVSVFNAPVKNYALMAAFKFLGVVLVFVAAYNFLRTEEEVKFFLWVMCVTLFWEMIAVLKLKYLDGKFQIAGTFEHQNSLSMYTNLIAMLFLAAGAGPKVKYSNLYLLGFMACAIIVECTLSRAGLVIFAVGTVGVMVYSLIEKPTRRRFYVTSVLAVVGAIGLAIAMDTIIERFKFKGNQDSAATREMLNEASRYMVRDYPLGIGWNNYGLAINYPFPYGNVIDKYFIQAGETIDPSYRKGIVESHYYLLLAETGYQAFICYLVLIGVFLYWNLRGALFFRSSLLGCVSAGILLGCGVNYLQSLLERVLTQQRNLMLWMILLALTSRIETWRRVAVRAGARRPSFFALFLEWIQRCFGPRRPYLGPFPAAPETKTRTPSALPMETFKS